VLVRHRVAVCQLTDPIDDHVGYRIRILALWRIVNVISFQG